VQIGLDHRGVGAEARAVNLQIFHYALDVVARLRERDAPTQSTASTLGSRGIAVLRHPLLDPAATGIVTGERHDVQPAILLEQGGDFGDSIWVL